MTTRSEGPAAAGRGRIRAGHADRDQAIERLKTAFVLGELTKDELETRAGQALAARTYADLAALTADLQPGPRAARPTRLPVPARRRPLARAAARSGLCLVIAAAAVWVGALLDPNGPGPNPYHSWAKPFLLLALVAVITAFGILADGVGTSLEQRISRRQLPPRPGPGRRSLDGERPRGVGHDPGPPGSHTDQTRADLRGHKSRQHQRHIPTQAGRAPCGVRPVPGAV